MMVWFNFGACQTAMADNLSKPKLLDFEEMREV